MSDAKELWYDWMGGNEVIFQGINDIRPGPYYNQVMKAISWVGDYERFPLYFGALLLWVMFFYLIKLATKQAGKKYYLSMWFGIFVMLGVGFGANALVVTQIKDHVGYPRPYIALESTGQVHKLEYTEREDDFRSFPSGHVAFTTFMVVALWPVLNGFLALCGVILITLVGWSRISLGVHFPMDVIGALFIIAPLIMLLRYVVYTVLRNVFHIKC